MSKDQSVVFKTQQINSEISIYKTWGKTTVVEALSMMQTDHRFSLALNSEIKSVPFGSVFFEMPPITTHTLRDEFEFALISAPGLDQLVHANDSAFHEQFLTQGSKTHVVSFDNLGGDAKLVVPTPRAGQEKACYRHLKAFVSECQCSEQLEAFWREVGLQALARIRRNGERPTWLSTSGLGVAWTHFRIEDSPKYFNYDKYKQMDDASKIHV